MSDIFLKLLNMSFAASWLIVAVMIFRLIARRIPRWIICLSWGLVAIRLICPFSLESPFSLVPSHEVIPKLILSEPHYKLNIMTEAELPDAYGFRNILMTELDVIWICGVFGLLFYVMIINLRLREHLKESVLLQKKIYLCDHVLSPFIFGFFCPHIYLPSGINESDMKYVIAHEMAHLQRKDYIWKMMAFFILTIYWFNPLNWVAFILFCRDIELACDEKVIKNLSVSEKKAYSESLLSCSFKKRIAIVYPLGFGEVGVKQRVKNILSYKKPTFWTLILSFLVLIGCGICFLTDSVQEYRVTLSTDISSTQIQIQEKEIELEQILMDHYKDSIAEASVQLYDGGDNNVLSANVLVVSKDEIANADKQNEIMTLVSEYLNLETNNIDVECIDGEMFSLR